MKFIIHYISVKLKGTGASASGSSNKSGLIFSLDIFNLTAFGGTPSRSILKYCANFGTSLTFIIDFATSSAASSFPFNSLSATCSFITTTGASTPSLFEKVSLASLDVGTFSTLLRGVVISSSGRGASLRISLSQ